MIKFTKGEILKFYPKSRELKGGQIECLSQTLGGWSLVLGADQEMRIFGDHYVGARTYDIGPEGDRIYSYLVRAGENPVLVYECRGVSKGGFVLSSINGVSVSSPHTYVDYCGVCGEEVTSLGESNQWSQCLCDRD